MADPIKPLVSFDRFIAATRSAADGGSGTAPLSPAGGPSSFEEKKRYILSLYEGIVCAHSFVDESGQIFDCVPIEQQPGLRAAGSSRIPQAPKLPGSRSGTAAAAPPGYKDIHGNAVVCPSGTIAMRRITLDELAHHETLRHFLGKNRNGRSRHPRLGRIAPSEDPAKGHRYAHAFQSVNNKGGHGVLEVCQPAVKPGQMSLSQHWYAGGSGGGLQTVEIGWQVLPGMYGDPKPHMFIYWTADDYQKTGHYNLEGGSFVQTNSSWVIGGALPSIAGAWPNLRIGVYLSDNKWWIYVNDQAIGYYPASIYMNGQLASNAASVDYGGETFGVDNWPPMGNGRFPVPDSAYQEEIRYFPFPETGFDHAPSLTASEPTPLLYKIVLGAGGDRFNYGGPGGVGG